MADRFVKKARTLSEKRMKEIEKAPGGSNVRHNTKEGYKHFAGTHPNTFPIDTLHQAKSALRLRGHDSNPKHVIRAVLARFPQLRTPELTEALKGGRNKPPVRKRRVKKE